MQIAQWGKVKTQHHDRQEEGRGTDLNQPFPLSSPSTSHPPDVTSNLLT